MIVHITVLVYICFRELFIRASFYTFSCIHTFVRVCVCVCERVYVDDTISVTREFLLAEWNKEYNIKHSVSSRHAFMFRRRFEIHLVTKCYFRHALIVIALSCSCT